MADDGKDVLPLLILENLGNLDNLEILGNLEILENLAPSSVCLRRFSRRIPITLKNQPNYDI